MKKLMVLGAGIYQVPLIRRAREMGIYTIAVSIPGNYPGFALSDKNLYLDTTDSEAVLAAARQEQIDGICTAGTDVAVRAIGAVDDALKLHGLSGEAARISTDKLLMKKRFEEDGVRTARFRRVLADEDAAEKTRDLVYPLIVKIVDSSGSRGIMKVETPDRLQEAVENALRYTKKDYYLVEEFITGREFGAQAFVLDGEVKFILPHGDYVFQGSTGVPAGHYAPFAMAPEEESDMRETAEKAIRAMKLDNCAVNCDFIMRDGKTYVLELGGRSGATCLAELVSIYYGYDYYQKIIETAMGGHPSFPKEGCHPNASRLLMSSRTGKIVRQENLNAPDDPGIVDVQFDYHIGDPVRKFHVGPDRIGHVITQGRTPEEAEEALKRAVSNIVIDVEEI